MKSRCGNCPDKAMPPASSPTKCGANRMVGSSPSKACTSPTMRRRLRNSSGLPCQSQIRSKNVCANTMKWRSTTRLRSASFHSGKHNSRFTSATWRRRGITQYSSEPSAAPRPRQNPRGSRASMASSAYQKRSLALSGGSSFSCGVSLRSPAEADVPDGVCDAGCCCDCFGCCG